MKITRRRPSYAAVVATIALFVALGGGAYAIGVAKNSVTSKSIKRGQVKTSDLGRGAVTGAKVKDGSLLKGDFAPGEIPRGEQGPPGEQGEQGIPGTPGADAATLSAYVSATGTLLYGHGATASSSSSTGLYTITFNRDLSGCVAMANSGTGEPDGAYGSAGGSSFAKANDITAAQEVKVAVITSNTGTLVNDAFTVAVFCP